MAALRAAPNWPTPLGGCWPRRGAAKAVTPLGGGVEIWRCEGGARTVQWRFRGLTVAEASVGGAPLGCVEEPDAGSGEPSLLWPCAPQGGAGAPRSRLFEVFMNAQAHALEGLSGFQEVPLPPALADQTSTRLVPQGPWGPPGPLPAVQEDVHATLGDAHRGARWGAPGEGKMRPRVVSRMFRTQRLRRVRFTYFDGGSAVQAFNSLCYPAHALDVPLLGVDLLAFGQDKILCVVDYQPVTETHHSLERAAAGVEAVKRQHADLFQCMTSRFFQDTRFFSPHMLLFRSAQGWRDPALQFPGGQLGSAFLELLRLYQDLLESAPLLSDPQRVSAIQQGQTEYDTYFSANDPAIKLFNTYFGEAWTERYTEEFLFPESSSLLKPREESPGPSS